MIAFHMEIIFSFPVGYFLTDRTRIIEAMTPTAAREVVSRRGSNAKFLVPAIFSNYGISVNPPRAHYKSIEGFLPAIITAGEPFFLLLEQCGRPRSSISLKW